MFISNLNFLETACGDVVGGRSKKVKIELKDIYQVNYNKTYQDAYAYAKSYKGKAYADADNDNYTYQENKIEIKVD